MILEIIIFFLFVFLFTKIHIKNLLVNESPSSSSRGHCAHWFVRRRTCLDCKTNVSRLKVVQSFNYTFSGLRLSNEAVSFTKRVTTLTSIHVRKKLHLVLDLDHTLIHSVLVSNLSAAEKYLVQEERPCLTRKPSRFGNMLIKTRPFVNEFLREANKLFDMYVYTKGDWIYAQDVVKVLDPNKTYFGDRVITRRESPHKKTLDLVLADERGIVIVDDTLDVWPHHKRNLLQVTRYFYFKNNGIKRESKPSYAERKQDESRSRGSLKNLLKFLKELHSGFFSCGAVQELDSKDVRALINGPFKPNGC
ncbi:unnamed protein product [Microthlaspi erraticum]|uniref:RNA polymerase II C-terminal domain phosphatase-like n=1 Tax=Microthlaspi erraticum TaxID=1685480 RepID=A0A6D2HPP0_9BRAS|nr:unnamed protein product [Microthlaspi erraticum]